MTVRAETRYGLADPIEAAVLSGLDFLQAMIDGRLPAPPMAQTLGFLLVEAAPGMAVFEGEAGPHLLNPLGSVHGGFALTLIDSAAGCALHATLPVGVGYTTIETKVNFTRAIRADAGLLRCEGKVVTQGRQIATAEARLIDGDARVLAHGTSTLIILQPR
jgi:uncharacterized protein (TIGR00369 family)